MLIIIFFTRIAFCLIEIKVRARQRRNETGVSTTADADRQMTPNDEEEDENSSHRTGSRRPSMAILYTQIVRSGNCPAHMQELACALFALQPIIFVFNTADIGKGILMAK